MSKKKDITGIMSQEEWEVYHYSPQAQNNEPQTYDEYYRKAFMDSVVDDYAEYFYSKR